MTQRLAPDRERAIRADHASSYIGDAFHDIGDLLAEITALRAELAGAEERGAARERAAAVAWLRAVGEDAANIYAAAIDYGDHVSAGGTAREHQKGTR